jgi:hypothetical protein
MAPTSDGDVICTIDKGGRTKRKLAPAVPDNALELAPMTTNLINTWAFFGAEL